MNQETGIPFNLLNMFRIGREFFCAESPIDNQEVKTATLSAIFSRPCDFMR